MPVLCHIPGGPSECMHLELVEVLYLGYQVVLQVQDLEMWADLAQQLDLLDAVLVQGNLLQRRHHALIVLGTLRRGGSSKREELSRPSPRV